MDYIDDQSAVVKIDVTDFRIQVISDVHLEMHRYIPKLKVGAEILCLCGDIGYPLWQTYKEFLSWASANYKWVFLLAGNHEFYHNTIPMQEMITEIKTICFGFPNITFLDNKVITVYYGSEYRLSLRIFGATMWSDTSEHASDVRYGMNDYSRITYLDESSSKRRRYPISPEQTTNLHHETRKKIREVIANEETPLIILTHHLPSFKCISPEFANDTLNCAYASDCDDLITEPVILWAFGHSHRCHDLKINNIRVVSNPLGYPGENTKSYQEYHMIDVSKMIQEKLEAELCGL